VKKNGFVVVAEKGISRRIVALSKRLFATIEEVTPIRHLVGVRLVNQLSEFHRGVWEKKDRNILGTFAGPQHKERFCRRFPSFWAHNCDCMIYLPARIFKKRLPRQVSVFEFLHTAAHEVIHYLQVRDRKKISERGVDKQAWQLLNRLRSAKSQHLLMREIKRIIR
jgi:hypothetical protein